MSHLDYIVIATVLGTILFGSLVIGVIIMVFRSRARQREHKLQMALMQSEMLRAQNEIREQTMSQISAEIHDNIGATLAVAKMQLSAIQASNLDERKASCSDLLTRSIQDLRNLSRSMNGNFLADLGLWKAIEREAGLIPQSDVLQIEMTKKGDPYPIDPQPEVILFRCVQECLNNAVRHSGASNILVHVDYDTRGLTIVISDNGTGIPSDREEGIGMKSLRERMKLLNGTLNIATGPSGTSITLALPINSPHS
ncbi:MAG: hypothetical protein RL220_1164 [Bacteroidota bacterium]